MKSQVFDGTETQIPESFASEQQYPLNILASCQILGDDDFISLTGILSTFDDLATNVDDSDGLSEINLDGNCFYMQIQKSIGIKIILIMGEQTNRLTNIFEKISRDYLAYAKTQKGESSGQSAEENFYKKMMNIILSN